MKREVDFELAEWKASKYRKPLVIRGARQVGKTFSVSTFAQKHFNTFIKLDFEKDRTIHRIFGEDLSARKLLIDIEAHTNTVIKPEKTILFFDEIQECERALLSLRYFYEEMPELHIIAAGSMLEFALSNISFPVGRVSFKWMRPMTFYEFLNASGQSILAKNLPYISEFVPVSESVHLKIMEQLRLYFLTGGMPEAVKRFCETNSITQAIAVHEEIFQSYLQSLVKYDKKADIDSLDYIMRSIPSLVGRQIKYTRLHPDQRIEKTKKALNILRKALIVNLASSSNGEGLPLNSNASSKIIKPVFLDLGLMQYACGINPADILSEKDLNNMCKGALTEQFAGQELIAAGGSENYKLFYWSRAKKSSSAEVDFLFVSNGKIYPLEVKSGPAGKLKSLHIFLDEHPDIEKGYVMSPVIFEKQLVEKITFIPIYTRFR